ncbi:glutamyl aminopeptidase-like [Anopheles cruzii]|uniref:glutamyl aminopeptidase-like n=1 Tax=Anopheles cruzii TaxID=68878 RepID=UPI0022EC9442|nr:glutamyl aminopeptidase-like [Anopheles cruzii]
MQYLERETEYIPWSTAYNALLHLDRMYSGQEGYSRFETFVRTITGCMYENVRLVGPNDHISRLHRGNTVYLACYSGVQACLGDATTQIQATIENPSFKVPEEAQAAVFCALHKHRLPVEPDYQMTWFENQFSTQDSSELDVELINRYLTSVGCSRNETILEYFLSLTNFNYPGLPITAAMKNQIFVGLANGGPTARMAALRYLNEHFSTVTYLLPNVGPIFTELGNRINVQSERDLLQEIVTKYGHTLAAAAKDAADQALVQAYQNIRWMQKYAPTVTTWLTDAMYEGTTTPKPQGGGAGRTWSTHALVATGLVLIVVNTLA